MEMKLNTRRIKTLRLNQSWSQEKLAEKAGLNPRTIQRVETDGSASLHTRLCLAQAFGLEPHELDFTESYTPRAAEAPLPPNPFSPLRSGYHWPLLLLISFVYLAWTPIYFSLSRSNFWLSFNQLFGGVSPMTWPTVTAVLWLLLALPWISLVYYRYRQHLRLHLAYLAALVCCSFLRVVQEEFTMEFLSVALYLCGLALLATCYHRSEHQTRIRQAFFICLVTYLFVWLLQVGLSRLMFEVWYSWQQGLSMPTPWESFPRYMLRLLRQGTQLFPMVLILLFDLGRPRTKTTTMGGGESVAEGRLASAS